MSDDVRASGAHTTSSIEITAPLTGVVEELAAVGTRVAAGAPVAVLESMKMHHEVPAPVAGTVRRWQSHEARRWERGRRSRPSVRRAARRALRPSRAERRRARASAPTSPRSSNAGGWPPTTAPDRRRSRNAHATGLRTARENVADLCDPGSFSEYGALALAAQRARRSESRS